VYKLVFFNTTKLGMLQSLLINNILHNVHIPRQVRVQSESTESYMAQFMTATVIGCVHRAEPVSQLPCHADASTKSISDPAGANFSMSSCWLTVLTSLVLTMLFAQVAVYRIDDTLQGVPTCDAARYARR
jgi:hypothetical protein